MQRLLLIAVLLCSSCNNNNSRPPISHQTDTGKTQLPVKMEKNTPTTFHYHHNYDSSKTAFKNLHSGWINTFETDGQQLRLRFDTGIKNDFKCYRIEQLQENTWKTRATMYLCKDEYSIKDMNNDGYTDFVKHYHERNYIYFYNPQAKMLCDSSWVMPAEYEIINKRNFLHFDFYEAMYGNPYPSSQLYTYKGIVPFFYYDLVLIDNDTNDIKYLNLYRHRNGQYDDTVFVKTVRSGKNITLDYKRYWQNNYRQLLKQ